MKRRKFKPLLKTCPRLNKADDDGVDSTSVETSSVATSCDDEEQKFDTDEFTDFRQTQTESQADCFNDSPAKQTRNADKNGNVDLDKSLDIANVSNISEMDTGEERCPLLTKTVRMKRKLRPDIQAKVAPGSEKVVLSDKVVFCKASEILQTVDCDFDSTPNVNALHCSQSKSTTDRYSLKSNFALVNSPTKKSRKRTIKQNGKDGRIQTTLTNFFTKSPIKTETKQEQLVSIDTQAKGKGSSSSSHIRLSTLDGFVVTSSPRNSPKNSVPTQLEVSKVGKQSGKARNSKASNSNSKAKKAPKSKMESESDTFILEIEDQIAAIEKKYADDAKRKKVEPNSRVNDLPVELLEKIFCQMPHNGMHCLVLRQVCGENVI
jgi:hypothetical protein